MRLIPVIATLALEKTKKFVKDIWHHRYGHQHPMGLEWTDEFLMKISELTGKPIPASLELERGRLVDMMTDSHTWMHGKKFSLYGDADFVMGMTKFLLEMGAEPADVLCSHANKRWLESNWRNAERFTLWTKYCSPYGQRFMAFPFIGLHQQTGLHDRQFLWQVYPTRYFL